MASVDLYTPVLVMFGAFYAFAGVVAARAALVSSFFDRALAAISGKAPTRAETLRTLWLVVGALLVLAAGVALALRLQLAIALFVASALTQALYLRVLAPRWFDRDDPPDAAGRRATTNAFILYCGATSFVIWAGLTDRLHPLSSVTPWVLASAAGAVAAFGLYVVVRVLMPIGAPAAADGAGEQDPYVPVYGDDDQPWLSLRIKLMADIGTDPLWGMDDGRIGPFAPTALSLSDDLVAALDTWNGAFQAAYDDCDPATRTWSETQASAHVAEGLRLAQRIADERRDLAIFAYNATGQLVEVPPQPPA